MQANQDAYFIMHHLIDTWSELSNYLLQYPEKLINDAIATQAYFDKLDKIFSVHEAIDNDKRFKHVDWEKNIALNFIKRSYLMLAQHLQHSVSHLTLDKAARKKLDFFLTQYLDALSPTNFSNLNPEVTAKIISTNGQNLMDGFKQFQSDLIAGKGLFSITQTDQQAFQLGENLACTKGHVIFQNEIMQLIYYQTTTKTVFANPILFIPPWINKFYILDLQPENSLVKWLVDKGFNVFMISWVNARAKHKNLTFNDYLLHGPLAAINAINTMTGGKKINAVGYCIGGTLLGCLLAHLAQQKKAWLNSATFLTTLFDFENPGDLSIFTDAKQLQSLDEHMQKKGYLSGRILQTVFSCLRANDLIWSAFVNHYLKGDKPKPFDLLFWNADATNIPANVHRYYLRNMYQDNLLVQPNALTLGDTPINLSTVNLPSYFLAAQDDHIIPWQASFANQHILDGKNKFILTTSGHVAGVINPPHKKKYGYYTRINKAKTPEKFLATADFHRGSWWHDWLRWLIPYAGERTKKNILSVQHSIEDAPGSYVKVTLNDIDAEEDSLS